MSRDEPVPAYPRVDLLPPPWFAAVPTLPAPPPRPQWALAAALFGLTFLSIVSFSPLLFASSRTDILATLDPLRPWRIVAWVWNDPRLLTAGFELAVTLLTILLAHELGHYLYCRRYRLQATLPYFLPVPMGFGTLGAFIRIRTPIRDKRQLFDVGVAGPLAGFAVLVPFLLYGIAHSRVAAIAPAADLSGARSVLLVPGRCLAIELALRLSHAPLTARQALDFHPVALGAWFGLFATALNLLPLSQLDGGHILYAVFGRHQRRLARPLWLALAAAGFLWPGWFIWCGIVFVLRLRHPPVADEDQPLGTGRMAVAVLALVLLVLSFTPVPLRDLPIL